MKHINKATAQQIAEAILSEEFTLEEAMATGKLDFKKRKEVEAILGPFQKEKELFRKIQRQVNENNIDEVLALCQEYQKDFPEGKQIEEVVKIEKQRKDKKAWGYANRPGLSGSDRISALQGYLDKYSEGRYASQARDIIAQIRLEETRRIEKLIDSIRYGKIPKAEVFEMLKDGRLSEEILVPKYVSKSGLEFYKNPKEIDLPPGDEKPIRKDSTDVYFIGLPNSGKSCLLSGLLLYAQNYYPSTLSIQMTNKSGFDYAHSLLEAASSNVVPGATKVDEKSINYIATDIKDDKKPNFVHPINFIDMSGEKIIEAVKKYDGSLDSVPFGHYLKSDNDKYFFIMIDYLSAKNGTFDVKYIDGIIQFFYEIGDRSKMLNYTRAINLVLTKSELLDGGTNDEQMAIEFITQSGTVFPNLYSKLSDLYDKYPSMGGGKKSGWFSKKTPPQKPRIYPYSLGEFELFDVSYTYNPKPSKKLFEDILRRTMAIEEK